MREKKEEGREGRGSRYGNMGKKDTNILYNHSTDAGLFKKNIFWNLDISVTFDEVTCTRSLGLR